MIENEEKKGDMEETGFSGGEEKETPESVASIPETKQEENETKQSEKIDHERLAKENYDRYLRTMADFENYKRRIQKEQSDLFKFANERIVKEMLPIVDNFERAISHSKETNDFDKMLEGLEMIQKQFLSSLEKFGVQAIESVNRPFDPFHHQSVGQVNIEEGSGLEENQIVSETQKGYMMNDRVLRPSLVILAKKAISLPDDEATQEAEKEKTLKNNIQTEET